MVVKLAVPQQNIKNEGSQWPQILTVTIASLTSLTSGMLFAWSSPSIVKITEDTETYNISEDEASLFTVIPCLVMIMTCPIFSKLSDKIGRKKVLYFIIVPHILSWLLKALTTNLYVFYLSRAIYGMSDGIIFSTLPMYIGEVTTPAVRDTWGNLFTFCIYFGIFLINVISMNLDISTTSYVALTAPVIFGITFIFMPESPYFYIMKKRYEEAEKSLKWLLRKDVEMEFAQLKKDVDRQMSETGTWKDLFVIKSNRRALITGVFTRTSQQFTGIPAFNVFTAFIFQRSGSSISPEWSAFIYTGLGFSLNFFATFTVGYFGKRKSYIVSLIFCAVALGSLSLYYFLDEMVPSVDVSSMSWFPLAGLILYMVVSSFGVAIVPTAMLGELFSTSIKAKGLSFLILVMGMCQFSCNYLFYILQTSFGFYASFFCLFLITFISVFISFFLIPETTGKTLEEIQQELSGSKQVSNEQ